MYQLRWKHGSISTITRCIQLQFLYSLKGDVKDHKAILLLSFLLKCLYYSNSVSMMFDLDFRTILKVWYFCFPFYIPSSINYSGSFNWFLEMIHLITIQSSKWWTCNGNCKTNLYPACGDTLKRMQITV